MNGSARDCVPGGARVKSEAAAAFRERTSSQGHVTRRRRVLSEATVGIICGKPQTCQAPSSQALNPGSAINSFWKFGQVANPVCLGAGSAHGRIEEQKAKVQSERIHFLRVTGVGGTVISYYFQGQVRGFCDTG